MFLNIRNWIIASVIPTLFSTTINAVEVEYSAAVALTAYDNITRVPEPKSNELAKSIIGAVSVFEDSANLTGRFISSIEIIKYQKHLVADETLGRLVSDATWRLIPNRFEWYVSDTFTQTLIDTLARDTPNNRQNTNAFTTGPNYIVRINRRNSINFNVRAKDFRYEANNASNHRISALGSWVYDINSSINIGLNYEKEDVNFNDNIGNSDFIREDAYFQLNYTKRKSSILMEYGETNVTNNLGNYDKASRYLLDYKSARRRDANSRITISRSVSDISGDVLNPIYETEFNTTAVNSDIFIDDTVRFSHTELYRSGSFTFNAYQTTNKYSVLVGLDRERSSVSLRGDWDNTGHSRITMQARYLKTSYVNLMEGRVP